MLDNFRMGALHVEIFPGQSEAESSVDPLDALARVAAAGGDCTLLHSGARGGASVLAWDPLIRVIAGTDTPEPLAALERAVAQVRFEAPHPLIGWTGFVSYDIGATLEKISAVAIDELHWPLLVFTLFRHYLLFPGGGEPAVGITLHEENQGVPDPWTVFRREPVARPHHEAPAMLLPGEPRRGFEQKIGRALEYIAAGDIYQANLAQHWRVRTPVDPVILFHRLCAASPAPFGAYMRFEIEGTARHVLSASPEMFLSVNDDGHVITRPIKGTRPRDPGNRARDGALRQELLDSPKDRAELAMIVDLLRNDLGRVSTYGSVRVTEPRALEEHPTVWHTAATIESDLRPGVCLAEVLSALCPGGSITGAPKIRAMQIIEELEAFRRGLYCGNIGVIGPPAGGLENAIGALALNIAIRTMMLQDGIAHVYAGAGIVADSDPVHEFEETLHKAAALFRALGVDPPR